MWTFWIFVLFSDGSIGPGLGELTLNMTSNDTELALNDTGGVLSKKTCRFQDVLDHLNLTRNRDLYYMTRPVNDYKQPTVVYMEMCLFAILDMMEKDQKFIPYVWTVTKWKNDYISWNKSEFCEIEQVSIPFEVLWHPDISIEEMYESMAVERDRAPQTPHIFIRHDGEVEFQNDQVLVCTCRMKVHRFPFDIQSCNLSFKSISHSVDDILLLPMENSSVATRESKEVMRTQYEWLFLNINVVSFRTEENQDKVVYTIDMKRRSVLYIVNFLLPVLFFLGLDLASFLVSHGGGEKLTFKVTVLLAITVLQLILNDILPSSSDRIPVIATYCIGIFALMLLSLLETIVVMYLMKKDDHPVEHRAEVDENVGCLADDTREKGMFHHIFHKGRNLSGPYEISTGETPSGLMDDYHANTAHLSSSFTQDSSHKVSEEGASLEKILDELKLVEHALLSLSGHHKEPGKWTLLAKRINKVFFVFYVVMVIVFLVYIYFEWQKDD